MSNIFNLEKVYAEIRQKHPLLTRTFPTISTQLKSMQHKSTQPKSTQLKSTSFYFFVDLSGIPFNKRIIDNDLIQTHIGNDLIQTSSSSLYDTSVSISGMITFSSSNYIGTHSSNSTVYNYDVQNDSRISLQDFLTTYVKKDKLYMISQIKNKFILQNEDDYNYFIRCVDIFK